MGTSIILGVKIHHNEMHDGTVISLTALGLGGVNAGCGFVSCDVKVGSRVERKAQMREQIDRASGEHITAGTSATFQPKLVGKSCGYSRLRYSRANREIDNVGSTNWGLVPWECEAGGVFRLSKRAFVAVDTTISTRPLTREGVMDKGITRNKCIPRIRARSSRRTARKAAQP